MPPSKNFYTMCALQYIAPYFVFSILFIFGLYMSIRAQLNLVKTQSSVFRSTDPIDFTSPPSNPNFKKYYLLYTVNGIQYKKFFEEKIDYQDGSSIYIYLDKDNPNIYSASDHTLFIFLFLVLSIVSCFVSHEAYKRLKEDPEAVCVYNLLANRSGGSRNFYY